MKKVLILGVNGFIGSHLADAIIAKTDWELWGLDLTNDKLSEEVKASSRFHWLEGDMLKSYKLIESTIQQVDTVLPLVAVATPSVYVTNPIKVFELDFEANLPIVRWCAKYHKHLVFPSTSEVYGCSEEAEFNENTTKLVTGPIKEERWIYSTSKQLMDRVIYALGNHGTEPLNYTIFRPFNWFGPRLDRLVTDGAKAGRARVLTQFISDIQFGRTLHLVGGQQRRCFTYVADGVDALLKIIANDGDRATRQIFNLGNPKNELSIEALAKLILKLAANYSKVAANAAKTQIEVVKAETFYAKGYADVPRRVPSIAEASDKLNWSPQVDMETGLKMMLDSYWL